MLQERFPDLAKCVEPDRVRREVYTDPQIFDVEMQRIQIGRASCRERVFRVV